MNNIIEKRTNLINFFLKENNTYTLEDILNKEFAVLSFSPTEEYIDILSSPYDHLCADLTTLVITNTNEIYVKGIIIDVDRQNFQTIIHIQNKDSIISISCRDATKSKYDDFFIVGEPIIAKCKIWEGRFFLSFLVQLDNLDMFEKECSYMDGTSREKIREIMSAEQITRTHYGLIVECSLVKTNKGKDMLRGTLFDGKEDRSFGIVRGKYNPVLPKYIVAGDYVSFNRPSHKFFISNMGVVEIEKDF